MRIFRFISPRVGSSAFGFFFGKIVSKNEWFGVTPNNPTPALFFCPTHIKSILTQPMAKLTKLSVRSHV